MSVYDSGGGGGGVFCLKKQKKVTFHDSACNKLEVR
jgi:hypothetical protein